VLNATRLSITSVIAPASSMADVHFSFAIFALHPLARGIRIAR
jgi:hypothetical protein